MVCLLSRSSLIPTTRGKPTSCVHVQKGFCATTREDPGTCQALPPTGPRPLAPANAVPPPPVPPCSGHIRAARMIPAWAFAIDLAPSWWVSASSSCSISSHLSTAVHTTLRQRPSYTAVNFCSHTPTETLHEPTAAATIRGFPDRVFYSATKLPWGATLETNGRP